MGVKVKGVAIAGRKLFVMDEFGEDKFQEWLDSLSPKTREVFEQDPVPVTKWYDLDVMNECTKKICEMFYDGDPTGGSEAGKFDAKMSLEDIYKKWGELEPKELSKRMPLILNTYYKNPDSDEDVKSEVQELEEGRLVIRLVGFKGITREVENAIVGWMEKSIELCGGKSVNVERKQKMADGYDYGESVVTWE